MSIYEAGLPPAVKNAASLVTFNVANYNLDSQGNDVNNAPWATLLAAIAADPIAQGRGCRIVFPEGDFCLNNVSLLASAFQHNGTLIIEGQGDATRIFPGGGQGRALTINLFGSGGGGNGQLGLIMRNLRLGYGVEFANPDLPYSQPILTIIRGEQLVLLEGITGYLSGTGTIVHLDSTYEVQALHCYFNSGQYAVPILWDNATLGSGGLVADTVTFRHVTVEGEYGIVMNHSGSIRTVELDQVKLDAENFRGAITAYDSYLGAAANAGDGTITLNAGDGAHFAAGDSIAIGEGLLGQAGFGFEANKVTAIAGDVLTLKWPLQYAHSNVHHCQVIKGGVLLVLPQTRFFNIHDSHFEAAYIGISAWSGTGLRLVNNQQSCNRFLRAGGALTDVDLGATFCLGNTSLGVNENILLDVPAWNTAGASRFCFDGPYTNLGLGGPVTITTNLQGTSYNIDEYGWHPLAAGAGFGAVAGWTSFACKTDKRGLRIKGFLQTTGALASGTAIGTLPSLFVAPSDTLVDCFATNAVSLTAAPAANSIRVRGSASGNPGQINLQVATTAAGYVSLDGTPPLSLTG